MADRTHIIDKKPIEWLESPYGIFLLESFMDKYFPNAQATADLKEIGYVLRDMLSMMDELTMAPETPFVLRVVEDELLKGAFSVDGSHWEESVPIRNALRLEPKGI